MTTPLTSAEEAAGLAAFDAWAAPQIESAGWLQRGAIKEYVDAHKQAIVDVIGPAIIAAHDNAEQPQPSGDQNS
jgi:hypothetical protein